MFISLPVINAIWHHFVDKLYDKTVAWSFTTVTPTSFSSNLFRLSTSKNDLSNLTLLNKSDEIINNYNLGILRISSEEMSFNKGTTMEFSTPSKNLEIYGKSNSYQGDIDNYFTKLINGVKTYSRDLFVGKSIKFLSDVLL